MSKDKAKPEKEESDGDIIFRWSYRAKNGRIVRAVGRPFPIRVRK